MPAYSEQQLMQEAHQCLLAVQRMLAAEVANSDLCIEKFGGSPADDWEAEPQLPGAERGKTEGLRSKFCRIEPDDLDAARQRYPKAELKMRAAIVKHASDFLYYRCVLGEKTPRFDAGDILGVMGFGAGGEYSGGVSAETLANLVAARKIMREIPQWNQAVVEHLYAEARGVESRCNPPPVDPEFSSFFSQPKVSEDDKELLAIMKNTFPTAFEANASAEAIAAYSVLPEGTSVDIAKDAPEHGGESGVVMNPAFITRVGGRARATGPRSRVIKLDGTDEYAIINTRFLTNKYAQDAQAGAEDLEATALFWSKKPEDEFKAWTTAVSKDFKTFNKGISWIANNDKINKLLLQTWREIRRSIPGAMLNDTLCKCTIGPAIVFPSAIKGEPGHAIVLTTANTAIFVEFNGPEQKKVIGKLSWVPKFTEMGNLAVLKALAARLAAAVRKERGMASQNDESRQDNSTVDGHASVQEATAFNNPLRRFVDTERIKDYAHLLFKGDNSYKLVAPNGLYILQYLDFLRGYLKYAKAEDAYERAQKVIDASTNEQLKQLAGARIPFVAVRAANLLSRDPNAGVPETKKQYVETFGALNSSILQYYPKKYHKYDVLDSTYEKLAKAGLDCVVIPGKGQEAVAFNMTLPDSRGRKASYETKSAADLRVGDRVTSGPETFEIVEIEEAGRRIEIGFRNEATDKVHFKKELPVTVFALAKPKAAGARRQK